MKGLRLNSWDWGIRGVAEGGEVIVRDQLSALACFFVTRNGAAERRRESVRTEAAARKRRQRDAQCLQPTICSEVVEK